MRESAAREARMRGARREASSAREFKGRRDGDARVDGEGVVDEGGDGRGVFCCGEGAVDGGGLRIKFEAPQTIMGGLSCRKPWVAMV